MCDILFVTHRLLCREDFLTRVEKIAAARPRGIILREKDLSDEAYRTLAERVLSICQTYGTDCILHGHPACARDLSHTQTPCARLHLPLPQLRELPPEERKRFSALGTSCHSVEEALEGEALGCTYLTAGHVFETDCKAGLPGRGIPFLKAVCGAVHLPVYAIGGISPENIREVRRAGAAGACVMSGGMTCENVPDYLAQFQEHKEENL